MTRAKEDPPRFDPQQASQSRARIAERSQRLVAGFLNRREINGIGMADPANVGKAFIDLTQRMMADPIAVTATTIGLWNEHLKLWQHTTQRLTVLPNRLMFSGLTDGSAIQLGRITRFSSM
jgi:hypothetical protein